MNEPDKVRIRHMLDAAREALDFASNRSREDLNSDQMLVRALSMSISIIGEAAARVSPEVKAAYPDIPWPQIIGMRNRIIHAYFEVNLDILWETVTDRLPSLLGQLEAIPLD